MARILALTLVAALAWTGCGDTDDAPDDSETSQSEITPWSPEPPPEPEPEPEPDSSEEEDDWDFDSQRSLPSCWGDAMACVGGFVFVCIYSPEYPNGQWANTGDRCNQRFCTDVNGEIDLGPDPDDPFNVNDETTTNPGPSNPDSNTRTGSSSTSSSSSGSSSPSVNTGGTTQPGAGGGGSSSGHGL